jgi:predicted ATP-grasp superfamily ATP-dependent carboligase
MDSSRAAARVAFDATTPIVAFGLSRGALHHGALGIARSAGRKSIPVYRVCRERWAPASLSRYGRGWVSIGWGSSDEQILEALRRLAGKIGRAILIPVDDAGSVFVDTHAAALEPDFLFPRQPPGLAQELSSKREMFELCQKHQVPTPASQFPRSEADVLALADQTSFPTVVKCINAGDAPPASPRVAIAKDRDELLHAYRLMESPKGSNVMLQEYIPGTPESVWMFNGYFDESSDCRVAFTGKKIRQSPPYTGATTLGVCEANPTVQEDTVRLMKAVGYRGILDIGFRFDHRDGQYKLLDVNPRIGGTFRLFVGPDGMDVLRAMYLDLTGQQVPATSMQEGRRWIVEPLDVMSSAVYHRRGDITVGGWVRSLRGVREAAWFARDDPGPFLALWLGALFYWLPQRLLGR